MQIARSFVFAFVWQIVWFSMRLGWGHARPGSEHNTFGISIEIATFFLLLFSSCFQLPEVPCLWSFRRRHVARFVLLCRCVLLLWPLCLVCGALHKETVDRPWPMAQIWHDMTDVNLFHFYVCLKMICFISIYVKRYSKHFDINDIKRKPRTCFSWMLLKRTRLQVSSSEVRSKQEKTSGWWGISGTGTSCHILSLFFHSRIPHCIHGKDGSVHSRWHRSWPMHHLNSSRWRSHGNPGLGGLRINSGIS